MKLRSAQRQIVFAVRDAGAVLHTSPRGPQLSKRGWSEPKIVCFSMV